MSRTEGEKQQKKRLGKNEKKKGGQKSWAVSRRLNPAKKNKRLGGGEKKIGMPLAVRKQTELERVALSLSENRRG